MARRRSRAEPKVGYRPVAVLPVPFIAAVALAAPPASDATVIQLSNRAPLAFVLNTPSGQKGRLRVSEIITALSEPLEAKTDLVLTAVDASAIEECEGALACLSRRVPRGADLLLVVSYFAAPEERPDRVSALLVDVRAADACAADPFGSDRVDACVSERAVRERPEARSMHSSDEARAALADIVQRDLRSTFEAKGHWEPTGSIRVENVPNGAAVLVDEETVGVAPGGTLLLQGARTGARRVAFSLGGAVQAGETVDVARGSTTQLTFELDRRRGFAGALFWSGVSLAAVGAGISIWSLVYAASQGDVVRGCPEPSCRSSFFTLEQQVRGDIEPFEENPNDGVILALPLGYALTLTGATWAVGAEVVEDDPTNHWILVAAGIVAGGLAYGISAAANGP